MIKGDVVKYIYRHWLNSKQSTLIAKYGVYLREVDARKSNRAKRIPQYNSETSPYSIVHFKGNKTPSKVLTKKLSIIDNPGFLYDFDKKQFINQLNGGEG
jgi:hypothetical protein